MVARPGDGYPRQAVVTASGLLSADELAQVETRIRDMGFYPYRTTDEELEADLGRPGGGARGSSSSVMRETLDPVAGSGGRQRLAGTGIPLYAMTGNDDPPELQGLLRDSPVLTEAEEGLVDLGEGITMLSFGYSNPTPWPRPASCR